MKKQKKPTVAELRNFFWHGTKGQNLERILQEGLKIATKERLGATQQFKEYHYDGLGAVCLTNHEGNGCFYAVASYPMQMIMTNDFEPVVLQINPEMLDKNCLFKRLPSEDNEYSMYKGSNEFDYIKDISPRTIVGMLKWNKEKRKYEYFIINGNVELAKKVCD